MSGLQLYLRDEEKKENTVVDFYLIHSGGKRTLKSSLMLEEFNRDKGLAKVNIRELGYDKELSVNPDELFTVKINDADINYKAKCNIYWSYKHEKLFISIDADKEFVYIGKHKHKY